MIYQLVGLIFVALEVDPYLYLRLVWSSRCRLFDGNLGIFNAIFNSFVRFVQLLIALFVEVRTESCFNLLISDICWEAIDLLDRLRSEIEELTRSLI